MKTKIAIAALLLLAGPAHAQDLTWAQIYAQQGVTGRAPTSAPLPTPRNTVAALVAAEARRQGVPVRLALGVAYVESRFRCNAVGAAGELGPKQVLPATARGLGYRGPISALNTCGAGLSVGMRHLALAYQRCGTEMGAARLHNRGLAASCHGATAYTQRVRLAMGRL